MSSIESAEVEAGEDGKLPAATALPGMKRPPIELSPGDESGDPPSQVRRLDPLAMQVHADTQDEEASEKNDDELEMFAKDMAESDMNKGGGEPLSFV